ncbi:MAG: hypothetical protein SGILL_007570 [Bacillariaceae sp.]
MSLRWKGFLVLVLLDLSLRLSHQQSNVSAFVPSTTTLSYYARTRSSTTPSSRIHEGILDRFLDPKIEDPQLPLTEAGLAQIAAPTLELFWLRLNSSPFPSWATPLYDYTFTPRGSLFAPTLVHGAGLACAWLLGGLAAKAYEKEAYESDLPTVVFSTLKAGAFATGILILGTQFDLYQEMGGYVQVGDSPETDLRIYQALVEVIDDIVFEAITLLVWRVARWKAADMAP